MGSTVLTGKDTIVINNRVLNDFADGDTAVLTYPNELAQAKIGKNGNSIIAFDNSGEECTLELRVLLGSDDDKFLLSILDSYKLDRASFILTTGLFNKRVGTGSGKVDNVKYSCNGGFPSKNVDVKENVSGDSEQAVAVYNFKFVNTNRSIM